MLPVAALELGLQPQLCGASKQSVCSAMVPTSPARDHTTPPSSSPGLEASFQATKPHSFILFSGPVLGCRDYRWMDYPARNGHPKAHPQDAAVQTYRGHHVLRTLMRARFSPMHSTGQAFIYTGSFDGSMHIYGACRVGAVVLASTGAVCECVRDASIKLMPGKSTRMSGACGPQQQLCMWRASSEWSSGWQCDTGCRFRFCHHHAGSQSGAATNGGPQQQIPVGKGYWVAGRLPAPSILCCSGVCFRGPLSDQYMSIPGSCEKLLIAA